MLKLLKENIALLFVIIIFSFHGCSNGKRNDNCWVEKSIQESREKIRKGTVDIWMPFDLHTNEEPIICVLHEEVIVKSLRVAIWESGRIVWSTNQHGGAPFYENILQPRQLRRLKKTIKKSGPYDDLYLFAYKVPVGHPTDVITLRFDNILLGMQSPYDQECIPPSPLSPSTKNYYRTWSSLMSGIKDVIPEHGKRIAFAYRIKRYKLKVGETGKLEYLNIGNESIHRPAGWSSESDESIHQDSMNGKPAKNRDRMTTEIPTRAEPGAR